MSEAPSALTPWAGQSIALPGSDFAETIRQKLTDDFGTVQVDRRGAVALAIDRASGSLRMKGVTCGSRV